MSNHGHPNVRGGFSFYPSEFDKSLLLSGHMQEKTIYFVRHGQSTHNAADVFQSPDSPLTELGKQQAQFIADRVKNLSCQALLASPWPRAKETAEIIAATVNVPVEYSDLFVERKKPLALVGQPYSDPAASQLFDQWMETMWSTGQRVADGENYEDIIQRTDEALQLLLDRPEDSIVVVTHGFFMRSMIVRAQFGDVLTPAIYKKFQLNSFTNNTGLSALRYRFKENQWKWCLWVYNDHAHLG